MITQKHIKPIKGEKMESIKENAKNNKKKSITSMGVEIRGRYGGRNALCWGIRRMEDGGTEEEREKTRENGEEGSMLGVKTDSYLR